jgi:hypothetical protein
LARCLISLPKADQIGTNPLCSNECRDSVGRAAKRILHNGPLKIYCETQAPHTGTPFSSISGLRISKLSIKWMRLGITHERIEPGTPTQNGRHERQHRTLKEDTATPPAESLLLQCERLENFTKSFNGERPHQALGMRTPASVYSQSERRYRAALDLITYDERHINGSPAAASCRLACYGQQRNVYFGTLHLGTIDGDQGRFTPGSTCLRQATLR